MNKMEIEQAEERYKEFIGELEKAIEENGITRFELAKEMDYEPCNIYRIFSFKYRISVPQLIQAAAILGMKLELTKEA